MSAQNELNGVPLTRSVGALVKLAESTGWTTTIRADQGQWRDRDLSLVVVSLRRGIEGVVAQWANGKADTCWRWPAPDAPWGRARMGYRELTAYLREAG